MFTNIVHLDGDVAMGDFVGPAVRWRNVSHSGSLKDSQNIHGLVKMTYVIYHVFILIFKRQQTVTKLFVFYLQKFTF